MVHAEDWERISGLIETDPEVWSSVLQALESGGGEDPWEALLDGLDDAGALAYLQADDSGMELADALAQLPRVLAASPGLGDVSDTDDLTEATALADAALRSQGLRLVRLVEDDDDSWPIVVVEEDALAEVVSLAVRLGHRAVAGG